MSTTILISLILVIVTVHAVIIFFLIREHRKQILKDLNICAYLEGQGKVLEKISELTRMYGKP